MTADGPRERSRVFFALWPDAEVTQALASLGREMQAVCGGRATAPQKIHITLLFVGEIERARVATLKTLASSIDATAFELNVNTIGYWRHNRIVWAGASHCPEPLANLGTELHRLAADDIEGGEDRPYVPHVTLVRNVHRVPKRSTFDALAWRAREFVLVESVSADAGVRYDVIGRWPLAASV